MNDTIDISSFDNPTYFYLEKDHNFIVRLIEGECIVLAVLDPPTKQLRLLTTDEIKTAKNLGLMILDEFRNVKGIK